jgi:hypothetical protein
VLNRPGPAPVHVQLGDRALDEVVGFIRVPAQQVGDPPQRRQPDRKIIGELRVTAPARHAAPAAIASPMTLERIRPPISLSASGRDFGQAAERDEPAAELNTIMP